jgi:hypothetical protein
MLLPVYTEIEEPRVEIVEKGVSFSTPIEDVIRASDKLYKVEAG